MSTYGDSERFGPSRDVLPASRYLQERLHERRTRNPRPKHSRYTDLGPQTGRDDDIFLNVADESHRTFDSSPLAAAHVKSPDAVNSTRKRAPGVRDMDQQIDRLSKQNFALKLELDHRREQTQKLQEQIDLMSAQVTRAEILEDEHKELLRINTQMVQELERRDKAVEEAMDIICDLEDKVADMEERISTRPCTANADSGYAGTETLETDPATSPQTQPKTPRVNVRPPSEPTSAASRRLQVLIDGQTQAKARREPSILSHNGPSTNALRSVYMENARELHPVKSFQSLLSRQESRTGNEDGPSSPRLSLLSESSFPSLYSPKKQVGPDRFAWEGVDDDRADSQLGFQTHLHKDSIKRVSQWISEGDVVEDTPCRSNIISAAMDDDSLEASDTFEAFAHEKRKHRTVQPRPTSFAGPIFGEPLLPPTPDTASTRMLRASRSSIADDRGQLGSMPVASRGHDTLQLPIEPGLRTAPRQMRSSVELRTAFASNMEYRNQLLDGLREIEDVPYTEGTRGYDTRFESTQDYVLEEDDFPDGKSIMLGTPRRLLKHARPPVSGQVSAANRLQAQRHVPQPAIRGDRPINHYINAASKPVLSRVETSPNSVGYVGSFGHMATNGKTLSAETITSPHSVHSGSSSNRTIVYVNEQDRRAMSPEGLTAIPQNGAGVTSTMRSSASPAPGRTLSQRTATLFRRLSNSHGSDSERVSRPSLASSPAMTGTQTEVQRPRTSNATDRPPSSSTGYPAARPPSARDTDRPAMQLRTRTEPATARRLSSAAESHAQVSDKEKKGFFKRSTSIKSPDEAADAEGRSGTSRRRGSLRDAVSTGRRPWR